MSRHRLATNHRAPCKPHEHSARSQRILEVPRRTAPYQEEPGYSEEARLWFYGNIKLLHSKLAYIPDAAGPPFHLPKHLDAIEQEAEQLVLESKVLVCGLHSPAHQRAAVVPLRWGSPRVVVFSGGFQYHLGEDLKEEPFAVARLWRDGWDSRIDLAVSRRAPDKLPTYAQHNPTVDRLIARLAFRDLPGLNSNTDLLSPLISTG